MSDYLWDKSGPKDPEVENMERLLSRFQWDQRPLPSPSRWRWPLTLAAITGGAFVICLLCLVLSNDRSAVDAIFQREYEVRGLALQAKIRSGDLIEVDSTQSAQVVVDDLGHVDFEPGSRFRIAAAGPDGRHEFFLEEGAAEARIFAAPRTFVIGTPAGLTVDMGCFYRVEVQKNGHSVLRVLSGQVLFEAHGRNSWVPSRGICLALPDSGPGSPTWDDTPKDVREALNSLDFDQHPSALARATMGLLNRPRDTLTLFHLLQARSDSVRVEALARIREIIPRLPEFSATELLSGNENVVSQVRSELRYFWY